MWLNLMYLATSPNPDFTLTELASLHLARHLLVPLRGTPLGEPIHAALEKIAATLAPAARAFLDRLHGGLSVRTVHAKDYSASPESLRLVQQAIDRQVTLEGEYHSFSRDEVRRPRLDPLHLWYQQGGLYLAAFCHRHREVRTFAVERFRAGRPTGEPFHPPGDFDIDRYLAGSFGLFRGTPASVQLRFSKAVARYVAERRWHPTQVAAPLLTGELHLRLRAPVCPELTQWILGYGKHVEVLAPKSLRTMIRREWLAALRGPGGRVETPPLASKARQPHRVHAERAGPAAEDRVAPSRRGPHPARR